jgi:hypothetical protein
MESLGHPLRLGSDELAARMMAMATPKRGGGRGVPRHPGRRRITAASACGLLLAAAAALTPLVAHAADLPGWDRTRWGMTSAEIARLYRGRAVTLSGRIDFDRLYTDVALRKQPFAGHDFTVYFQMDNKTHRLSQVLLERRRQYATAAAWRDVLATLEHSFGATTKSCERHGNPLSGEPQISERVWALPTTTVYASYLDFGNGERSELSRRLLVRYAPAGKTPASSCR